MVALFGAPSTLQILPKRLVPSTSFQHLSMASLPRPLSISTLTSTQTKSSSVVALLLSTDDSHRDDVLRAANSMLSNCLSETHLDQTVPGLISKTRGKVRDVYDAGDHLVLVTTDRQSAFDRVLPQSPSKVLNETSLWWFNKTRHITPNALVSAPDRNVTILKKCPVFPVEFVVRGYTTGRTDTSLWTVYESGVRNCCGNALPEGLVKNQKLSANILTPTTKAADHDVPVSPDEVGGIVPVDIRPSGIDLFSFDTNLPSNDYRDTPVGAMCTPPIQADIELLILKRFNSGLEPENVVKEFLRLWFKEHCNPYEDEVLPEAPTNLVCKLAWRYIFLFEAITNAEFQLPVSEEPIHDGYPGTFRVHSHLYECRLFSN